MDDLLPPFGIRHLRKREPFSVIQIRENDYSPNLTNEPLAKLTYIDEDDGEVVTIGSELEFRQRLEDPLPHSAPLVHCYNLANKGFEDRKIHLFDVERTGNAWGLWNMRRRTYRHEQKVQEKELRKNRETDSVSSINLDSNRQIQDNASVKSQTSHHQQEETTGLLPETNRMINLSDALPDLVDNLANIFQRTSETLRKAAEKSRQSNTTPIEDVLSGVGHIATEIGQFGVSLLSTLDKHSQARDVEEEQSDNHEKRPDSGHLKVGDIAASTENSGSDDVVTDNSSARPQIASSHSSLGPTDMACTICTECNFRCFKTLSSGDACSSCFIRGRPCSLLGPSAQMSTLMAQDKPLSTTVEMSPSKDSSILDQDTEDADFSRRYPPLMSLRRANTIAALHDRYHDPEIQGSDDRGLVRHNSWVRKYPHRPVPRILDEETQRRRDFAQSCFPTQEYTPEPDFHHPELPPVLKNSNSSNSPAAPEVHSQGCDNWKPWTSPVASIPSITAIHTRGKSGIEYVTDFDKSSTEPVRKALPGAWPKSLERQPFKDAHPAESSGAFFNRMMRDNPSRSQQHAKDMNERLTRHRSFVKPRSNNNPFSELNRSRTINSASNPASRLNHPFEPLYPVIVPQTSLPPTTSMMQPQNDGPTPSFTSTETPKLAERPSWAQRPFSPVWEENFGKQRTRCNVSRRKKHVESMRKMSKPYDNNGESISMYSPPPRHMRSVPNLSTSMMDDVTKDNTPVANRTSTISFDDSSLPGQYPGSVLKRANLPVTPACPPTTGLLNTSVTRGPMAGVFPEPLSSAQPLPSTSARVYLPFNPSFPPTSSSILRNPLPHTLPNRPRSPKATEFSSSGPGLHECLRALRDMGYGSGDQNLAGRLHVYAQAANGDVMKAVDMIEEDREANLEQTVESD